MHHGEAGLDELIKKPGALLLVDTPRGVNIGFLAQTGHGFEEEILQIRLVLQAVDGSEKAPQKQHTLVAIGIVRQLHDFALICLLLVVVVIHGFELLHDLVKDLANKLIQLHPVHLPQGVELIDGSQVPLPGLLHVGWEGVLDRLDFHYLVVEVIEEDDATLVDDHGQVHVVVGHDIGASVLHHSGVLIHFLLLLGVDVARHQGLPFALRLLVFSCYRDAKVAFGQLALGSNCYDGFQNRVDDLLRFPKLLDVNVLEALDSPKLKADFLFAQVTVVLEPL
mmetsp:Transcript_4632/g.9637  ORF Transcript_4632/g.9637 Transcript_4632/m.9637 type:complete len:280 (+) Transcript_4632:693-1532(+)